jgi:drug/metabolite transporter (DMT)-like permease
MRGRAFAWMLGLGAVWGSSYVFITIALRSFDPIAVAAGRQAIAAVCLLPLALRRRTFRRRQASWAWIVVVSVVMVTGPTVLVAAGQQSVPSSLAGILVASSPVFTALLAARIDTEERATPPQFAGVVLGLLGVILLFGVDLRAIGSGVLGGLALVTASLGYAIGGFLVKRIPVEPVDLSIMSSTVSAVLLLPLALVTGVGGIHRDSALAVVELGVVGTAVGWILYYEMINRFGPGRASVVQYVAPSFALILGVVALDDRLRVSSVLGLVLVLGGSLLASSGPRRAQPAARP